MLSTQQLRWLESLWLGDIMRGQIGCGINMPVVSYVLVRTFNPRGLVSAAHGEFSFNKSDARSASRGASARDFARFDALLA